MSTRPARDDRPTTPPPSTEHEHPPPGHHRRQRPVRPAGPDRHPLGRASDTPWGAPSDEIFRGRLGDAELAFLPRHGRGHRIPPSEVNYRANIAALKQLGATDVLSLSAVGGLRADLPPGTFVVVDQFIDRTFAARRRASSAPGWWRMSRWPPGVPAPGRPRAGGAAAAGRAARARRHLPGHRRAAVQHAWPNRSSTAAGTAASSA